MHSIQKGGPEIRENKEEALGEDPGEKEIGDPRKHLVAPCTKGDSPMERETEVARSIERVWDRRNDAGRESGMGLFRGP